MIEGFDDKILGIIENVMNGTMEELNSAQQRIFDFADECEKTKFYQENKQKAEAFEKEFDMHSVGERPVFIYRHLAIKIAYSPTKFHADGTVVLVMPLLKKAIIEANQVKS
jgi:hypothetical protein